MNERVTVHNFRRDPMFARIERAVAVIYARHFVWPGKALFHPPRDRSDSTA